jgi:hypothetical protein
MTGWVMTEDQFNTVIWIAGTIFTGVGWFAHWTWERYIRSYWYAYLDEKFPKKVREG